VWIKTNLNLSWLVATTPPSLLSRCWSGWDKPSEHEWSCQLIIVGWFVGSIPTAGANEKIVKKLKYGNK
tara:strand:- start:394 stop:600 length:207 start_codon:yes stop_codon:yes gene_type:complete